MFVPGVVVSNRYNPTQDPRLAIRGFGARSAFGIRGVRVLRDGIPLTVADGQTAVDFMDLESLGAAELFRGSAAALGAPPLDGRRRTERTDVWPR